MRRFEFREGASNKFWEIELEGGSFTVRWGRVGATPQEKTKSPGAAKAQQEHDKLVREKLGKGYVEVGAAAAPAAAPAPKKPAPKKTAPKKTAPKKAAPKKAKASADGAPRVLCEVGERVHTLALLGEDRLLVGTAGAIEVRTLGDGKVVRSIPHRHKGGLKGVVASPDGRRALSVGGYVREDPARLWDLATGKPLVAFKERGESSKGKLPLGCHAACFAADGQTVLGVDYQNNLRHWRASDGEHQLVLETPGYEDDLVFQPATFSPDASTLVNAHDHEDALNVWATDDGGLVFEHVFAGRNVWSRGIDEVVFTDGGLLVVATNGGGLVVVESLKAKVLFDGRLPGYAEYAKRLVDDDDDGDGDEGDRDGPDKGPPALALAVSPDEKRIAYSVMQALHLLDVKGKLLLELEPGDFVTAVRFTADGKGLIAGCDDGRVLRWDV